MRITINDELRNKIVLAQHKMNEIHSHPLRYFGILEDIVKELDVTVYNDYIDRKYFDECYCNEVVNKAECV